MNNWGNYTQSEVSYDYNAPVLISYATPVGIEVNGNLLVSERKHSSTTQRQINRYCRESGLRKVILSRDEFNKQLDSIGYSTYRGRA